MTDTAQLTAALAGRYRIERELGAGGMATVYLAVDPKHSRKVAIKVLRPELSAVIGAARFLQEIHTIAALQHPHILGLIDSGEVDGTAYYVMPFVEGESLRDRLAREKQLPVADAVRIAVEVAGALDYAHRHGVVHRDIKPENILLHDGAALVADFGIALAVSRSDGGTRLTETGMSLGTPHYMSPEQAMGDRALDARTDIYALGCVLYECLAGEPPFTGPTAQAIVAKVMTAPPESIATYRSTVPPVLADAVHTALQKLPADRFATAAEFGAALAGDGPSLRRSGPVAPSAAPRMRWLAVVRHPVVWFLGVVALASSAFGFREWSARRHASPPGVIRFFVDLPTGYSPQLSSPGGPNLAISPDGSTVAFPVTDPQGARKLFVRQLDQADGRVVPGTEDAYALGFTADGAALVFWAAGRLQRVALAGGAPLVVAEPGLIWSYTVLPNGDMLITESGAGTRLLRIPATGGPAHPVAALDSARGEGYQLFPVALPDGTHALYQSWGRGGAESVRIGLLDLSRGVARRLDVQGTYPLGMLDGRMVYVDQAGTLLALPLDVATGEVTGQPQALGQGVTMAARGSAVAVLSPSGTLVYLGGDQVATLVLANASGEQPLPLAAGLYGYPRYSPDGKRLAVTAFSGTTSDIWLADVASGAPTRLTSGGSVNERPEWSPDGGRVLFRTVRGTGSALWWQPTDGSGPATPLVASDSENYFEGVFTPDGQEVVYQVDKGQSDLLRRRVGPGGPADTIANSLVAESQARVSPDGNWVAYVTGEAGVPQVVVQPLSGHGPKVQVSVRGGNEPVWSRDGHRIFYRAEGKFKVANVSAAPTFHVTSRADFMDDRYLPSGAPHANYDVSPDGSGLLVLKGEAQRLLVVYNWGSEVAARLDGPARK